MLTQHYYDTQSRRRIPDPTGIDWYEAIESGRIDVAKIVAALLLVIAKGGDEGREAINGMLNTISIFLQMDGKLHFHADMEYYEKMNDANIEFARFLMMASKLDAPDRHMPTK